MMMLVVVVGLPSAWRNPTALALVLSWAFGYVIYLATGDAPELKYYVMADIAVLVIIICKPLQFHGPYENWRHQLQCFFLERSIWDRAVVLIFPLVWVFYVVNISEFARYWALYGLYGAQLLASSGEALQSWLVARKANAGQVATTDEVVYRSALAMGHG